jgi:hypothetical protein
MQPHFARGGHRDLRIRCSAPRIVFRASREFAMQTLRERTDDFDGALRMLQGTLGAQPGSS